MNSVLVLNATFEPLHVVSLRRAIVLLLKDKAEILEATESRIRSAGFSMPTPLVIRLVYYVRVPHRISIPLTRRTVMMRDNYTCQYCGVRPPKNEMTIDHIIPRVRGGQTTWENVVCACRSCNLRKGSKSLAQSKMRLCKKPARPKYVAMVFLSDASSPHDVWRKYISTVAGSDAGH